MNTNTTFTRRLTGTEIALGWLVFLPLFLFLGSYISSAVTKFIFLMVQPTTDTMTVSVWLNLINDILLGIALVIGYHKFYKRNFDGLKKNIGRILLIGILVGGGLDYAANIVGSILTSLFSNTASSVNQQSIEQMISAHPFLIALPIVFFAPVIEETLFRGLIFGSLREKNRILAYVVSAFLFGFVHIMSEVLGGNFAEFLQIFPYMLSGFVYAYVYEKADNIYASMLTHAAMNSLSLIFILASL